MYKKDVTYHLSQLGSVSAFTVELRDDLQGKYLTNLPSTTKKEIDALTTLCTLSIGLNKFFKSGIRQCMPLLDHEPSRQAVAQYGKSLGKGFLLFRQINIVASRYLANNQTMSRLSIAPDALTVCLTADEFVSESKKLCHIVSKNGGCTRNYTAGIIAGMENFLTRHTQRVHSLLSDIPKPCLT
jgi:hypothetical protein